MIKTLLAAICLAFMFGRTVRLLLGALSLVLTCSAMADDHPRVDANKISNQTAKSSIAANSGSNSEFAQFPEKIESKYLVFYSAIPHAQLQAYAHFADMFLDAVNRDFIQLRVPRKINAIVLPTKDEFQRYLIQQQHISNPPGFGIFLPQKNLFVTYDGSGLGTFAHEIMHSFVENQLPARPSWAAEGIPTFFEKFYGYEEEGKLHLKWGFQNPWRIAALGDGIPKLKMIRIMYGSEDESEQRLLSVFLYQRGKLKTFLQLIQAGDKKGFRTYVEAAFNKPMYDIEDEWRAYLNSVNAKREQIAKLPASLYFQSAQEFASFEAQNLIDLNN